MFIYYAKRKKDIAKKINSGEVSPEALRDEGYYTLISNNAFEGKTLKEIEKIVGEKAVPPLKQRIGRKKQKKGLIL